MHPRYPYTGDMDFLQLLPRDVVFNHILNRLDFIGRVRAGAVCRAWRDLSRSAPLIAGMPWICHTAYDDYIPGTIRAHYLINLSSSTTCYPRGLPITNDQRFHGSHGGPYLTFTYSHPTSEEKLFFSIYNPFNGDFFQLPSTVRDHEGLRHPMRWISFAQLSSKPPTCVVAANSYGDLYICRPGDDDWMKVRLAGTKGYSFVFDMMFYKGELYCIDEERIIAFDIQSLYDNNNFSFVPCRDILVYQNDDAWCKVYGDESRYTRQHYLVESGGELLVVGKYTSTLFYKDHKIILNVHRVDEEQRMLVPMDGLNDHRMLFVARGSSHSWFRLMNKVDIPRDPSNFFTENCIYFLIPIPRRDQNKALLYLGKFCLDKGPEVETRTSFELHPDYTFQHGKYWPVWIIPTYPN